MKLALAGLLLAAVPAPVSPAQPPYHYPMVKQVICHGAKGTAFRLGLNVVTAAHVTSRPGCRIEGDEVSAKDEYGLDFALLSGLPIGKGMTIDCGGFVPGRWYHAVGYASGNPWQMTVTVLATYKTNNDGMRVMMGYPTFIPGMSGGPVMNEAGEVVGIVNAYWPGQPFSASRELKDTSLCA